MSLCFSRISRLSIVLPVLAVFGLLSHSVLAGNITVSANPAVSATSTELVTLGLPLPPCAVDSVSEIRVTDSGGQVVPVFTKPLMTWHFNSTCLQSVRVAKLQFRADLSGGNQTYTFDFGGRNTANDIFESDIAEGTVSSSVAGKGGVLEPRVVAVVDPEYLKESGFIPSYELEQNDSYDSYIATQFDTYWRDFSFDGSSAANWLFDRTTTLYKYAMRTGRVDVYLEAYRSFNWWYDKLEKNSVSTSNPDCRGGFDYGDKKCDQKYTYVEPIKLHLGLSGDDSQYDSALIRDIADTAWNTAGFAAQGLKAPYTTFDRAMSERGIGLTLLTQVAAFELIGDAVLKSRITGGIDNIHSAQNVSNPDGLPLDGSIRHSWRRHEGEDPYLGVLATDHVSGSSQITISEVADVDVIAAGAPIRFYRSGTINLNTTATGSAVDNGNGTWTIPLADPLSVALSTGFTVRWNQASWAVISADRGFSPWMTENISDGMWHAYAVLEDDANRQSKIAEYFKGAAKAIALHGITPQSLNSQTRSALESAYSRTLVDLTGNPRDWQDGCSTTTPVLMYYGSGVAPLAAIRAVSRTHSGTDQHLPETVLTLALGGLFEEDTNKKAALRSLIADIEPWFDTCTSKIAGRNIPWRSFNWQHRSNAWGTYLWTLDQEGISHVGVGDDAGGTGGGPIVVADPNPPSALSISVAGTAGDNGGVSGSEVNADQCINIFCASFFANTSLSGTPAATATHSQINFDWRQGSPVSGVSSDNFSVRWIGNFDFDGEVTIRATTDDGMRVYIDNQLVIDQWRGQAATTYTYTDTLVGRYEIKVEYYDGCCSAVAQVSWSDLIGDPVGPVANTPPAADGGDSTDSTPEPVPDPDAGAGGDASIAFTEVTNSVLPDRPAGVNFVQAPFEGDWVQINEDSCYDIIIASHGTSPDGLYIQNTNGDACAGTFTQLPNNYEIAAGSRRITSSVTPIDIDSNGTTDWFGWDADGAPSQVVTSSYNPLAFTAFGGGIQGRDFTEVMDYNNDSIVDGVTWRFGSNSGYTWGQIFNLTDQLVSFEGYSDLPRLPSGTAAVPNFLIFDANVDGYPDLVHPVLNFVYLHNGASGGFTLTNDGTAFPNDPVLSDVSDEGDSGIHNSTRNRTLLDYDNDGDMDIFMLRASKNYSGLVVAGTPVNDANNPRGIWLLRNNGDATFTDVTADEMNGIGFTTFTYTTTYSNFQAGDFNNDGLTDIFMNHMDGGKTGGLILQNNGGSWSKISVRTPHTDADYTGTTSASGGASKPVYDPADYDFDGDLDLVGSARRYTAKDHAAVLRSDFNSGNWLHIYVRGCATLDCLNARVLVRDQDTNEIISSREVISHAANSDGGTLLHVGLGGEKQVNVDVVYPHNGGTVRFSNVSSNQIVALFRSGEIVSNIAPGDIRPSALP